MTAMSSPAFDPDTTVNMEKDPFLPTSINSTAPSNLSTSSDAPKRPLRFVDLPPEIRNQIYRYILIRRKQPVRLKRYQGHEAPNLLDLSLVFTSRLIYSEAMPIFLSKNNFLIAGSRSEHAWLRRMRPEGRSELRKVTLAISAQGCNHDYSLFNALSLCPQVHLTLIVRPSRLAELSLENSGNLRNMHGFAAVTSDVLPKETSLCPFHRQQVMPGWELTQRRDRMRCFESVLRQFQDPCVGKCRVHKGRDGTHTQATIHISFAAACDPTCYRCC